MTPAVTAAEPPHATPNRALHERWLLDVTSIPTAAGREHRVTRWIERWVSERADLSLRRDPAGNLVIERASVPSESEVPPLFITAHLDHPAFVVERIIGPGTLGVGFRGGVLNPYFHEAPVTLFSEARADAPVPARVISTQAQEPYRQCVVELDGVATVESTGLRLGDVGRWALRPAHIEGGMLRTHACDDLAALAAALAAFDDLRSRPDAAHVRLLFTRAEEIGFVGAIAACRHGTIPRNARVLALENSRSFPHDSPIHAGPIVRVGDRISTFSPTLTAAVAKCAEALARSRAGGGDPFRWQRKLMPGGACEASAFQAYGLEATCVCLPLGNYHNMADLERVQAGEKDAVENARAGHEFIGVDDFHGLVDLLIACGTGLAAAEPLTVMMERLYSERAFVLGG
ncbi:MAG: M20/M25/M40 family metallo-hydrolase [Phycisphaerales bacterium]